MQIEFYMNEEHEKGMFMISMLVIICFILLLGMCSCTGKKVVSEQIYVHDTLVVTHTDTLNVERWSWRHDTIRVESEKVVTLLQADKTLPAETVRIETNNWHFEREVVRDSASKVVARLDSVLKVLDQRHDKKEIKKANHYGWQGFIIFLVAVTGCCIYCLMTIKKDP